MVYVVSRAFGIQTSSVLTELERFEKDKYECTMDHELYCSAYSEPTTSYGLAGSRRTLLQNADTAASDVMAAILNV